MYIQTQDKQSIINMKTIKKIYRQEKSIYADDILLGTYTGEKRLNGALSLCRSALCKGEAKSSNSLNKEDDFYYEMPNDDEELDNYIDKLEYIQHTKEINERLRRSMSK